MSTILSMRIFVNIVYRLSQTALDVRRRRTSRAVLTSGATARRPSSLKRDKNQIISVVPSFSASIFARIQRRISRHSCLNPGNDIEQSARGRKPCTVECHRHSWPSVDHRGLWCWVMQSVLMKTEPGAWLSPEVHRNGKRVSSKPSTQKTPSAFNPVGTRSASQITNPSVPNPWCNLLITVSDIEGSRKIQ